MMDLSVSERISMIRSAVLIQYTRVTDRQTDRQTDRWTELAWHICAIAYMLSRVKINKIPAFYMIFARKMPKFFIISRKIFFFRNFRGTCPPAPVFYAYVAGPAFYSA